MLAVSGSSAFELTPLHLCADFNLFPPETPFATAFELASFHFTSLAPGNPWMANSTEGDIGLFFRPEGVEVELPTMVSSVDLRIGTFNSEVQIDALNTAGESVKLETVPHTNSFHDIRVSGRDVSKLILRKGGFEGMLVWACIDVLLAR